MSSKIFLKSYSAAIEPISEEAQQRIDECEEERPSAKKHTNVVNICNDSDFHDLYPSAQICQTCIQHKEYPKIYTKEYVAVQFQMKKKAIIFRS